MDCQMEEFIDRYESDPTKIKKYHDLSKPLEKQFIFVYMVVILTGTLLSLMIYAIPGISPGDNVIPLVIIGGAIMTPFAIIRIFQNKIIDLELDDTNVTYHYLASAISSYSHDSNIEGTYDILLELKNHLSNKVVLHPKRQYELEKYIESLENAHYGELEHIMGETFLENMGTMVSEILEKENEGLKIPESKQVDEYPPTYIVWFEAINDSITSDKLGVGFALIVIVLAGVGYATGGAEVAVVVLAAFPVLQFLTALST